MHKLEVWFGILDPCLFFIKTSNTHSLITAKSEQSAQIPLQKSINSSL